MERLIKIRKILLSDTTAVILLLSFISIVVFGLRISIRQTALCSSSGGKFSPQEGCVVSSYSSEITTKNPASVK